MHCFGPGNSELGRSTGDVVIGKITPREPFLNSDGDDHFDSDYSVPRSSDTRLGQESVSNGWMPTTNPAKEHAKHFLEGNLQRSLHAHVKPAYAAKDWSWKTGSFENTSKMDKTRSSLPVPASHRIAHQARTYAS
jgi:hypothetical protein